MGKPIDLNNQSLSSEVRDYLTPADVCNKEQCGTEDDVWGDGYLTVDEAYLYWGSRFALQSQLIKRFGLYADFDKGEFRKAGFEQRKSYHLLVGVEALQDQSNLLLAVERNRGDVYRLYLSPQKKKELLANSDGVSSVMEIEIPALLLSEKERMPTISQEHYREDGMMIVPYIDAPAYYQFSSDDHSITLEQTGQRIEDPDLVHRTAGVNVEQTVILAVAALTVFAAFKGKRGSGASNVALHEMQEEMFRRNPLLRPNRIRVPEELAQKNVPVIPESIPRVRIGEKSSPEKIGPLRIPVNPTGTPNSETGFSVRSSVEESDGSLAATRTTQTRVTNRVEPEAKERSAGDDEAGKPLFQTPQKNEPLILPGTNTNRIVIDLPVPDKKLSMVEPVDADEIADLPGTLKPDGIVGDLPAPPDQEARLTHGDDDDPILGLTFTPPLLLVLGPKTMDMLQKAGYTSDEIKEFQRDLAGTIPYDYSDTIPYLLKMGFTPDQIVVLFGHINRNLQWQNFITIVIFAKKAGRTQDQTINLISGIMNPQISNEVFDVLLRVRLNLRYLKNNDALETSLLEQFPPLYVESRRLLNEQQINDEHLAEFVCASLRNHLSPRDTFNFLGEVLEKYGEQAGIILKVAPALLDIGSTYDQILAPFDGKNRKVMAKNMAILFENPENKWPFASSINYLETIADKTPYKSFIDQFIDLLAVEIIRAPGQIWYLTIMALIKSETSTGNADDRMARYYPLLLVGGGTDGYEAVQPKLMAWGSEKKTAGFLAGALGQSGLRRIGFAGNAAHKWGEWSRLERFYRGFDATRNFCRLMDLLWALEPVERAKMTAYLSAVIDTVPPTVNGFREFMSFVSEFVAVPKDLRKIHMQGWVNRLPRAPQAVRLDKSEKAHLQKVVSDYLSTKLATNGISIHARKIFGDSVDSTGRRVLNQLEQEGLWRYLLSSSGFMTEEGMARLGRLVDQIYESTEKGRKVRYDELTHFGFSAEFVRSWSQDVKQTLSFGTRGATVEEFLKVQANQLSLHNKPKANAPIEKEELNNLPEAVDVLMGQIQQQGDVGVIDDLAQVLLQTFERDYAAIRSAYGDLFANIRVDLRNLTRGLTLFERIKLGELPARSSEYIFEVSGEPLLFAQAGSEPYPTCQRLTDLYAKETNGNGQPISRMLHGQFKVAALSQGKNLVARTMLEVTRDSAGQPVLLVERFYEQAGFAFNPSFRQALLDYAQEQLGIPPERVYFTEQALEAPPLLRTEDTIYRDTFGQAAPGP